MKTQLPIGLSAYEFKRTLTPSRDLPNYFHLRMEKDATGVPVLTGEVTSKPTPIDLEAFFKVESSEKMSALSTSKPPQTIEIEVGCGKGTFMVRYCELNPDIPFLALEKDAGIAFIAASRLAKRPLLQKTKVILCDAAHFFRNYLPQDCAHAVHVYFPDPWPKMRHRKNRILQQKWLEEMRRVCIPGAILYFGTDHAEYNTSTRALFGRTPWLTMIDADASPTQGIQTNFEKKYRSLGKPIYRCNLRVEKGLTP